jgi:hypothetical protein
MGAWGSGNFESDAALDHVYRLLITMANRVEKAVKKVARHKHFDLTLILADLELMGVIARHVYKAATMSWVIRGQLLPDHLTLREWKAIVLGAWDRAGPEGTDVQSPKDHVRLRRGMAATFDKLARMSRQQIFGVMRTLDTYLGELYGDEHGLAPSAIEKYEADMHKAERQFKEQEMKEKETPDPPKKGRALKRPRKKNKPASS